MCLVNVDEKRPLLILAHLRDGGVCHGRQIPVGWAKMPRFRGQPRHWIWYRHQTRCVLAIYAFNQGWSADETISKLMHTTDTPRKVEYDVRGVYDVLESDPHRYSVGCGEGSHLRSFVEAGVTRVLIKQSSLRRISLPAWPFRFIAIHANSYVSHLLP